MAYLSWLRADTFLMNLGRELSMRYERIRDLREDADLYQRQLAELLHCSQRIYSNYERGDVDIPTQILIQLADYYGTTTDYLLGRTNYRSNPFPDRRM